MFRVSKSILIFALAILSVYQVSQLWFINITDRNFILYVTARFAPVAPNGIEEFARPFRIIHGHENFSVIYSGISRSTAWTDFGMPIINETLTNGVFLAKEPIPHGRILEERAFIFEYAFLMSPEIFTLAFGQRAGGILESSNVENFYRIAVIPSSNNDFYVFFMDDNYAWGFEVNSTTQMPNIAHNALLFSPINGLNFKPQVQRGFTYHPVTVVNPYQDTVSGGIHFASISPRIENFFNNPATINQSRGADGIYNFNNMHARVRYLINDVLEYTSFRPIGTTATSPGLTSNFSSAFAFVESDPYVINEFFLAGYEIRGREYVFWFDYVINNFPLRFAEPWETGPSCRDALPHPIEVVVDHGRVVRYRRLAYSFVADRRVNVIFNTEVLPTNTPFSLAFPISQNQQLSLHVIGGTN